MVTERERDTECERERQQREREGGRQKRALTFCEGYKKSSSLRGHPTI